MNNLTYLRARYYDPKLGRFLTQDSIIPDMLNGQAWNAYAYVYNDTINLVDPSGHGPIDDWIVDRAINAPDKWKSGIRNFSQGGLNTLNWWKSKPDNCDCVQEPWYLQGALGANWVANQGSQLAWSGATTPIRKIAALNLYTRKIRGEIFDYRLVKQITNADVTGEGVGLLGPNKTLRQLSTMRQWPNRSSYLFKNTSGTRAALVRNIRNVAADGALGFNGSVLGSGIIDGLFQLYGDFFSKCLSPEQTAWRAIVALGFGLAAGLVGALAASAAIALGATGIVVGLTGFAAGALATYVLSKPKNKLLDGFADAY